ncbi:MAG: ATP-binding protein [Methylotenera sp.]|uniref:sensor histidine kinase n=1 Tax=Methylotenera sp. TaxID=2051956 RepID=UPI0024883F87|nr:ATP-binding protein [Methylotenera sp.]MDI1308002.1 ATP-binding protein [Methylotenera sp.]
MGRLFWKFFIFFFLAQLTSVIGVGLTVSIMHEREQLQREHEFQMQAQNKNLSASVPSKPLKPRHKRWFPQTPILVGALASFIFAAILAWYFSKPIKQLRQAFASAANGNLNVRLGKSMGSRRDELVDLGNAFDVMAVRLGALLQSQTRLLHQVSHELRSPLARMQIAVGLARQQPDKLESSLTRIERESERMDALVGELLALSRLESGVIKLDNEPINLNELLTSVIEDARFEGEARKITIGYVQHAEKPDSPVTLLGQQDLLHRAIDNVLRNALKYSPSQSHISITSKLENALIKIEVNDQGAGVANDELENIFQAFFRGSNTNQTDGHGVGLAIAKQIIEAHGGTIEASNITTGGLSVKMKLPVS